MNVEVWKPIPNFSRYEISTFSNIRNKHTNNLIVKYEHSCLYYRVSLVNDNNEYKNLAVHRLMAIVFIPNPNNKPTVNHKDHNKLNNNIENLEWSTQKEQNLHKRKSNIDNTVYRKVTLTNVIEHNDITFNSITHACNYIYNNVQILQKKYNTFDDAKNALQGKLNKYLQNELTNKLIYRTYKLKYCQITFDGERWEKIPPIFINNTENCFVSTIGRIKNATGKIFEGNVNKYGGYVNICINSKKYKIHRLVAQTFIPNPEKKEYVNHIDGNKQNNKLENLEWNTPSENNFHKFNILYPKLLTKKVYQYDLNMNLINEHTSITNASKNTNISYSSISNCCKEKLSQTCGFVFRFENNKNNISIIKKHKNVKSIIQCNMNLVVLNTFNSIQDASTKLNLCYTSIRNCCIGKQKQAGGYIFKYNSM